MPMTHPSHVRQEAVALVDAGFSLTRTAELMGVASTNTIRAWVAASRQGAAFQELTDVLAEAVDVVDDINERILEAMRDLPEQSRFYESPVTGELADTNGRIITPRDQKAADIRADVMATSQALAGAWLSASSALRRLRFFSMEEGGKGH